MTSHQKIQTIQGKLLTWYNIYQRDLPWRRVSDPYKIWVSEIMLQQTRVDTVIPYYNRFIEQFPTLTRLAEAPEDQVIKAWEGLGYYSRVRNLHSAVKEVVERYDGVVPSDLNEISKLKGVGPYTAGAILSIAYNKRAPAVDGNVMRVCSRIFAIHQDIMLTSTRKKIEMIAYQMIPEGAAGDFNQALMELGAMVCMPTLPQCLLCPLNEVCDAHEQGIVGQLPVKKKAKVQVIQHVLFAWVIHKGQVLVENRPKKGLLAGMSGLPTVERVQGEGLMQSLNRWAEENALSLCHAKKCGEISHVFSHRHWKGVLVHVEITSFRSLPKGCEWVEVKDLFQRAFPVVYQKVIKMALNSN